MDRFDSILIDILSAGTGMKQCDFTGLSGQERTKRSDNLGAGDGKKAYEEKVVKDSKNVVLYVWLDHKDVRYATNSFFSSGVWETANY